jgi:hypothetical protein
MHHSNRPRTGLMAAVGVLGALVCSPPFGYAAAESSTGPPADVVAGAWQHHKVTFSYFGFTSLFTCNGLEDHVRQILLHIGARKDAKVTASGCGGALNTPSHNAWVSTDFYTLAPAAGDGGSDTVRARWTPLEITPRRPNFMTDGDCELMQSMKDFINQNFTLRDVEYRTSCVPHEMSLDGYAVKGQALRALPSAGAIGAALPAGASSPPIIKRGA